MTLKEKSHKGSKYDVIIVGGGPSGSAAAIMAGREGAKVLLIEQTYSLGGMWTSGFVTPLFDYENKTGLLAEIVENLKEKKAFGGFWDKSFNFEYMKYTLEKKCIEAGVDILYDTKFVGTEKDGEKLLGVYVSNVEGITYFESDIFIDASGDGCVAYDMGLLYNVGRDEDPHTCQAMTLMFLVGGIPQKYKDGLVIYDVVEKAFEKEGNGKHLNFDMPYLIPIPDSDFALIQLTHMNGYSSLSALDRSRAAADGREQVMEVFEALKYFDDDFKDLYLIFTAPLLGVRESRRIKGEYTLTKDDILSGSQFDDGVCTVTFWVDIHPAKGEKQECAEILPYQIPFRSMLPKNSENLIIAGKNISGDHIAHASYRVTGNCFKMGEAAGKAAAYCIKNKTTVRMVPNEIVAE